MARPKKHRPREEVLNQALLDVADRESVYGDPHINHARVAHLWAAYRQAKAIGEGNLQHDPVDSVMFQIVTNIARLIETPGNKAAWDNIAGYAGIGYEVTT